LARRRAIDISGYRLAMNYFWAEILQWLIYALVIIGYVGFINLYNFMDGIDGITAIETLSICVGIIIVLTVSPEFPDCHRITYHAEMVYFLPISLALISLAFLPHNWYPAKIFLGDVGSITIGYMIGFCLLYITVEGYWYAALTLPLYYLADGGITLLRRIMRRERFWEAHRTHFYQRAALAAGRHDVVVKKIALCNGVLILIAVMAVYLQNPWLCLLAPVPVGLLLYNLSRQTPALAGR
jgi:UDP-N-acetylmuramyl pentapeptide phosphotransferase/UDP-N-acetylglucosamine-1-phosphate transferase